MTNGTGSLLRLEQRLEMFDCTNTEEYVFSTQNYETLRTAIKPLHCQVWPPIHITVKTSVGPIQAIRLSTLTVVLHSTFST